MKVSAWLSMCDNKYAYIMLYDTHHAYKHSCIASLSEVLNPHFEHFCAIINVAACQTVHTSDA
jgi:hypothetical protein